MAGKKHRIARARILEGIKGYTQEQQEILLRIHGYWVQRLHSDKSALIDMLGCDWTTWTRIIDGKYPTAIDHWMERSAERAMRVIRADKAGTFVHTVVTRRIHQFMDYTRDSRDMCLIMGPSRTGKTEAVKEWARRNNHGASIYLDCPIKGGKKSLYCAFAKVLGFSTNLQTLQMELAIENAIDQRNTIIVDEAQRLLPSTPSATATGPLDFIRRLHDDQGASVVFVSTMVFDESRQRDVIKQYMEQLYGRIGHPFQIPGKATHSEVYQICEAFREDPPKDMLRLAEKVANGPGRLARLFQHLSEAASTAKQLGVPPGAKHVQTSIDLRAQSLQIPQLCTACKWSGIPDETDDEWPRDEKGNPLCLDCHGKLLD